MVRQRQGDPDILAPGVPVTRTWIWLWLQRRLWTWFWLGPRIRERPWLAWSLYPPAGVWYGPVYNAPYGNPYTMNPEDEVNMLKDEANAMKSELDAINKRIEELKTEPAES